LNFLADEGVDQQIVDRPREEGHTVTYIAESEPGISDDSVLETANRTSAVLVTGRQRLRGDSVSPGTRHRRGSFDSASRIAASDQSGSLLASDQRPPRRNPWQLCGPISRHSPHTPQLLLKRESYPQPSPCSGGALWLQTRQVWPGRSRVSHERAAFRPWISGRCPCGVRCPRRALPALRRLSRRLRGSRLS